MKMPAGNICLVKWWVKCILRKVKKVQLFRFYKLKFANEAKALHSKWF